MIYLVNISKEVALVGNQSSILNNGVHIVDTLLSLNHKLIKVFLLSMVSEEKEALESYFEFKRPKNRIANCFIIWLIQETKLKGLEGIELIFDIQDVGVRFYTHIYFTLCNGGLY